MQALPVKKMHRERQHFIWCNPVPLCLSHLYCVERKRYRGGRFIATPRHHSKHEYPALQSISLSFFKIILYQFALLITLFWVFLSFLGQMIPLPSFCFSSFQKTTFKAVPRPPHLCWLLQIYLDKLMPGYARTNGFSLQDNFFLDCIYPKESE